MDQKLSFAVSAARALVIFVAIMGFFLGQLLLGEFSIWKTLAGVLGIVAAGFVDRAKQWSQAWSFALAAICALAAIAVMFDARDYFERYALARNTYPWFLTAPYVLGLALIALRSVRR
ncbi:MAG: hypothetical protein ACR2OY_11855 [Boseongicola sp.]